MLRGLGVRAIDLDDVTQDMLLGAWTSAQAQRYRPCVDATPPRTLRAWLEGSR
ncbi:uncharacterized protein SOCE836_093110 [Sorangium cellulosum]|uniref:Uncharacterized protein n=1 Tax=Sorangium cellulosum TaxID=56 RepID=A0A4P2R3D4_SORCE|nr:uncharacterized protein SOCE836_093110 [Sorangium cellulosum]